MRIAHLADLHLGYRAYHRSGPGGSNARERDVYDALGAAVDRLIELRPDLVLLAGDVFHGVRPPNAAIATAFRQLARLRRGLPDTPVVVIAGNHDSPRSADTVGILGLLGEIPGVTVVEGEARRVRLERPDCAVMCVPHAAARAGGAGAWAPDPAAAVNVLLFHGVVTGPSVAGALRFLGEYGAAEVELESLSPGSWDYVALGHYHIATRIADNAWYAGSTERTSPNIWAEADGAKGFLTFDTDTGRVALHELATRPVLDLPAIPARTTGDGGVPTFLEPAELDRRIERALEAVDGGIEGKIVRLVLYDVGRELFRALDHGALRRYRARALHLHLDPRRPPAVRPSAASPQRRRTLEEELEAFLRDAWEPAATDIAVDRLVELGLGYLREAVPVEPDAETLEP